MNPIIWRIEKTRVHLPPVDEAKMKYFAVFIMLIDHVTYAFLERAYGSDGRPLMFSLSHGRLIDSIGRSVGRQAFPIFCFFLVEGFYHTHSRIRYFAKMLFFALLSQIPFQKCFFPRSGEIHASVMCTLAIGLLAIWTIDELRRQMEDVPYDAAPGFPSEPAGSSAAAGQLLPRRPFFLIASCGTVYGLARLAMLLHSDYSYGGVILIVLMYLLRDYRISALFVSWAWLSWYNKLELYAAPAFFLLACYNGQRGRQHKFFFYIFYPAHILALWLVRRHFFGM